MSCFSTYSLCIITVLMTPFSVLTYCSFFTHYKRKRELTRELVRTWQYGHPIAHTPILVPSRDPQEHAIENWFRRIPLATIRRRPARNAPARTCGIFFNDMPGRGTPNIPERNYQESSMNRELELGPLWDVHWMLCVFWVVRGGEPRCAI